MPLPCLCLRRCRDSSALSLSPCPSSPVSTSSSRQPHAPPAGAAFQSMPASFTTTSTASSSPTSRGSASTRRATRPRPSWTRPWRTPPTAVCGCSAVGQVERSGTTHQRARFRTRMCARARAHTDARMDAHTHTHSHAGRNTHAPARTRTHACTVSSCRHSDRAVRSHVGPHGPWSR
jgi:hypothetical protein